MIKSDLSIMISGQAGDGILFTGDLLAKIFKRTGLEVFTHRDFPSNIRGEPTAYTIRASEKKIYGPSDEADILVAFDCELISRHLPKVNKEGFVICDHFEKQRLNSSLEKEKIFFNIPIRKLARDYFRREIFKNVITLGILSYFLQLELDLAAEVIEEIFLQRKGKEVVDKNIRALELGKKEVERVIKENYRIQLPTKEDLNRLLITGDEAVALGALTAGCRFFSGYPICPASEIMEWLVRILPKYNGVVVQVEDEIAAIHMTLGASYAGARAMTATSGPGFSLMSEGLSLAGMAEIPIVIVYVQRLGPSTGMPTKSEQGDLNHSLFAGHGDFPRIVISPATIEDCFYLTAESFNLAEKFQCPVILLTEQLYAQNYQTVEKFDFSQIKIDRGKLITSEELISQNEFLRYKFTKDGVSPRTIPSMSNGIHMVEGNEHSESGYRDESPENRKKMMEKRMRKLKAALNYLPQPFLSGSEEAKIGIIGFGSTFGAIQEVKNILGERNLPIQTLHLRTLWPLSQDTIKNFISSKKKVFIAEHNATGQLCHLLHLVTGPNSKLKSIRKFDSQPFRIREIVERIEEEIKR
ncbi:MAG: 2-oxoacid:acceptor oxidoreductase subunit alpha [Candidatus Aminicenantia bacterium]